MFLMPSEEQSDVGLQFQSCLQYEQEADASDIRVPMPVIHEVENRQNSLYISLEISKYVIGIAPSGYLQMF